MHYSALLMTAMVASCRYAQYIHTIPAIYEKYVFLNTNFGPKMFFSCSCLILYRSYVLLCKRGITPSRYYSQKLESNTLNSRYELSLQFMELRSLYCQLSIL